MWVHTKSSKSACRSFASCFYILLQGTVQLLSDPLEVGSSKGDGDDVGGGGGGGGGDIGSGPFTQTLVVRRGDRAGLVFGLEALSPTDVPRAATCQAIEPCTLLVFNTQRNGETNAAQGSAATVSDCI